MSLLKRLRKNLIYKTIGEIISRTLAFVYYVVLARMLGVEMFGIYSFTFSFSAVFMIFLDFGMNTVLVRDISANPELKQKYVSNIFSLKIIIFIIYISILILNYPKNIVVLVLLMGIILVGTAFLEFFNSIFSSVEKMEYEAVIKIVNKILLVVCSFLVLRFGYKLKGVVLSNILVYLMSCLLCIPFIIKIVEKIGFDLDLLFIKKILLVSLSIGITTTIIIIYSKIDVILLSFLKQPESEIGLYGAIVKLYEVSQGIPLLIVGASLPIFSDLYKNSKNKFRKFFKNIIMITFATSIIVLAIFLFFPELIIRIVYGKNFLSAVLPLKIIMASVIFMFVNYVFMSFLIVVKKQKLNVLFIVITLFVNIFCNMFLIQKIGYVGASVSKLISEFILFCGLTYFVIIYFIKDKLYYE
ncbi:MAG: flippase [Endomicrobiia bacterium]